jgi:hypothetical protein
MASQTTRDSGPVARNHAEVAHDRGQVVRDTGWFVDEHREVARHGDEVAGDSIAVADEGRAVVSDSRTGGSERSLPPGRGRSRLRRST